MSHKKKVDYSVIKTVLRFLTLGASIASLIISISNWSSIKWLERVQDNVIEKVLFHE